MHLWLTNFNAVVSDIEFTAFFSSLHKVAILLIDWQLELCIFSIKKQLLG